MKAIKQLRFPLVVAAALVASPVYGDINVLSHTVETEAQAIGGGGATPFTLGPAFINRAFPLLNVANNSQVTGVQPAKDGAGNVRGSASGTGIATGSSEIVPATSTITGSVSTLTQFTSTGDLGSGLGKAVSIIKIDLIPTVDTDFTLTASMAQIVGPFATTDVFSIRRTDIFLDPPVSISSGLALINTASTAPINAATGTLVAGGEYTITLQTRDITSGGTIQSPGDEQTGGQFELIFEQGTVIDVSSIFYLPGDTDGDGDVDDSDLGTSFSNYTGPVGAAGGKTAAQGDTDGDGDVDDSDLGTSFTNYTGPLAPANIPEPGSLAAILLGGLCLARPRARRARC